MGTLSVDVVDVTKVAKVLAVCSIAVVPSLGFDNIYTNLRASEIQNIFLSPKILAFFRLNDIL